MRNRRISALLIAAAGALLWNGSEGEPNGAAWRLVALVVLSVAVVALRQSSRPL